MEKKGRADTPIGPKYSCTVTEVADEDKLELFFLVALAARSCPSGAAWPPACLTFLAIRRVAGSASSCQTERPIQPSQSRWARDAFKLGPEARGFVADGSETESEKMKTGEGYVRMRRRTNVSRRSGWGRWTVARGGGDQEQGGDVKRGIRW